MSETRLGEIATIVSVTIGAMSLMDTAAAADTEAPIPFGAEVSAQLQQMPAEVSGTLDAKLAADHGLTNSIATHFDTEHHTSDNPSLLTAQKAQGASPLECKTTKYSLEAKDAVNLRLWTFSVEVQWCYDGKKVLSYGAPIIKGDIADGATISWKYQETSSNQVDWYNNQWVIRTTAIGKFTLCDPIFGVCPMESNPGLIIDTYGNGKEKRNEKK